MNAATDPRVADLLAKFEAACKQFATTNVNPPVAERTYILGIIDGNDAVHSVIIGVPGQIHEDFGRWRPADAGGTPSGPNAWPC